MKPSDDDTIILLIGTALGAVWEQLGGVHTHIHARACTYTLAQLEIHTVVVTLVNV